MEEHEASCLLDADLPVQNAARRCVRDALPAPEPRRTQGPEAGQHPPRRLVRAVHLRLRHVSLHLGRGNSRNDEARRHAAVHGARADGPGRHALHRGSRRLLVFVHRVRSHHRGEPLQGHEQLAQAHQGRNSAKPGARLDLGEGARHARALLGREPRKALFFRKDLRPLVKRLLVHQRGSQRSRSQGLRGKARVGAEEGAFPDVPEREQPDVPEVPRLAHLEDRQLH